VELESLPEMSERKIKQFEEQLKILNERKAEEDTKLQEVFAGLKDATCELQMEKDKKEKVLGEKRDIANAAKTKLTLASEEMELFTKKQTCLQAQLEKAQESARTMEQTVKARRLSLKQLEKDLPATQDQLRKAEKELEMTVKQEEELTAKVTEMIAKVEQNKVSLSASQQQSSVLNALMEQKRTGQIKGIHGRLGDLGRVDDKYDVAVSTACGALDYIVVESMDVAQQCVEFLKSNRVGMATFIGMDKMEKWRSDASKRITTPQNVPRLFDLVHLKEPRFSTVFYYALRDTLVANDLDQATQIAYKGPKRYQVVTLKGEVIDMSGTMSGGGSRVIKGRMTSKFRCDVSAEELKGMEGRLERDSQQLEALREQHFALEDKVNQLKKTVNEMESNMEKYNAEIQGLSVQVTDLKKQIPNLEREVKDATPDQKKLKSLQASIAQLDQEWQRANADVTGIEAEVQGLHQKIMEIGSSRLETQQARVDSISSEIDEVTRAITKAKVTIKTAERNLKKCQKNIASLEKTIASTTEKISNLEEELKQLEDNARAVIEEGDKAKEEAAKYESSVTEMRRLMADVEKECSEAEAQLVDVRYALHASETRMKENQQKMKHWRKELGKISVQSLALEGEETSEQLKMLTDEELRELDIEELQYKRAVIEEQLKDLKPNMAAVEEYRRKEKAYLARVSELDAVTQERDEVRRQYEDIRKQRLDEFMQGFTLISTKLKEMYQMLTLGGDAELELVDSLDPFSEGLVFSVRPPKKSWKNISNLSGGEKTLSSLALVRKITQNMDLTEYCLLSFRYLHCIITNRHHCMSWMR
jgi:structural maintenance of chromosome 4